MGKSKVNDGEMAEVGAVEAVVDKFDPVAQLVRGDCRDAMLGAIRASVDWGKFNENQQRDINNAVNNAAEGIVRKVVAAVAAEGRQTIAAKLDKLTVDGGLKLNLSAMFSHDALVLLGDMQGGQVLLVAADIAEFDGQRAEAPVQPDQAPLLPEGPAGDQDLVDAADVARVVRTGDALDEGVARVNIGTGMVEALPDGADGEHGYVDIREATPAELAAERERLDDFGDDDRSEAERETELA